MGSAEEKKKMIRLMAQEAGLLEDPHWLDRLDEPVPLWVVLEMLLKWIDRNERRDVPFD